MFCVTGENISLYFSGQRAFHPLLGFTSPQSQEESAVTQTHAFAFMQQLGTLGFRTNTSH